MFEALKALNALLRDNWTAISIKVILVDSYNTIETHPKVFLAIFSTPVEIFREVHTFMSI